MDTPSRTYVSLEALAARLGLPQKYLRDMVESDDIPCLDVNGRLRFNESDVRAALKRLAATNRPGSTNHTNSMLRST